MELKIIIKKKKKKRPKETWKRCAFYYHIQWNDELSIEIDVSRSWLDVQPPCSKATRWKWLIYSQGSISWVRLGWYLTHPPPTGCTKLHHSSNVESMESNQVNPSHTRWPQQPSYVLSDRQYHQQQQGEIHHPLNTWCSGRLDPWPLQSHWNQVWKTISYSLIGRKRHK